MFGNEKKEFGDYQTPLDFCHSVCKYLKKRGLVISPEAIVEPTCGIGNFIRACLDEFSCHCVYGVEINPQYAEEAKQIAPAVHMVNQSVFDVNVRELVGKDHVLVIGNPPWATNANLKDNLPQKVNFKGLSGIDALTGCSNFDICEYIILQMIHEYRDTSSVICMLCKTSVARNVIMEVSRSRTAYQTMEMLKFNSHKVFGISAAACVFLIQLSGTPNKNGTVECQVKDFESGQLEDTLFVKDGLLRSTAKTVDLSGQCQLVWRQGIKHDCGKVMELDIHGETLVNKYNDKVNVEDDLVFPLAKSSHFKKPVITEFTKSVIVTQQKPRQDTSYIRNTLPLTWKYLQDHISQFNNRKSVIYANAPAFSIFGIGAYSFAPYKVGLSGFYKRPLFALLHASKPVMTDDTVYFLSFDDYDTAYCMMLLLNSRPVQQFLLSVAFLDNKRPYTAKLLSHLDLQKCVDAVGFEELVTTEGELGLPSYVTAEKYDNLSNMICRCSPR